MADVKKELIALIQHGLELEHAARIQYLAHAEIVDGINAEPIIARLRELAGDEEKHEEKFRKLLGDYLGAVPSMGLAPTKSAKTIQEILKVNLKAEEEATVFYKELLDKIYAYKKDLRYEWETLEHEVRHIVIDEQEHIAELKILLGMR